MGDDDKKDDIQDEEVLEVEAVEPAIDQKSDDTKIEPNEDAAEPKSSNIFKRLTINKKLMIPLFMATLIGVLAAIPLTRYSLLGTVAKSSFEIGVRDDRNSAMVSGARVTIDGQTITTDGSGKAKFAKIKPGKQKVHVEKKYYKSSDTTIKVQFGYNRVLESVPIVATGRLVPVVINNKITGKPLSGAQIKAADTDAKTDTDGKATIVVPADKSSLEATVNLAGYNNAKVNLNVTESVVADNAFSLVPTGKIYFLSKLSGKIDVVKTDLDGANRATVLVGTGKEEDRGTVLLATRDWKYLALQSRREGDRARLYMIDTTSDKLTEIDSGDATFSPVGWNEHSFIYQVTRNNIAVWQPKKSALKTYSAETQQLATIDETAAEGSGVSHYARELIENVYVVKNDVIYSKRWESDYYSTYLLATKRTGIYTAKSSGTGKQVLKDFDAGTTSYISAVLSEPTEIYYSTSNYTTNTLSYYEYANGKISENKDLKTDDFAKAYPSYLQSPSGQKAFWYEPRDGKNSLFIGTSNGESGKEVASLSEYIPYGWYSDDYLLVSKKGSELYILPTAGLGDKSIKVTDYHKPDVTFLGYGGGYGGQ